MPHDTKKNHQSTTRFREETDTRGSRKLSESLDWRELGSTACLDSRPSTLQAGTLEVPCEVGKKQEPD